MQQRATLTVTVYTATGDHAEARGVCCHQRPCERLWPMLSPETMWKSVIQAVLLLTAEGNETAFAVVLMTVDSQLRKTDIEGFCDSQSTPKTKQDKHHHQPQRVTV